MIFLADFLGSLTLKKSHNQFQISQGSGFIVTANGYILTNNHVVSQQGVITVTLNDGSEYAAKVIGLDDSTDLALLKIEAEDLAFLKLGKF